MRMRKWRKHSFLKLFICQVFNEFNAQLEEGLLKQQAVFNNSKVYHGPSTGDGGVSAAVCQCWEAKLGAM